MFILKVSITNMPCTYKFYLCYGTILWSCCQREHSKQDCKKYSHNVLHNAISTAVRPETNQNMRPAYKLSNSLVITHRHGNAHKGSKEYGTVGTVQRCFQTALITVRYVQTKNTKIRLLRHHNACVTFFTLHTKVLLRQSQSADKLK